MESEEEGPEVNLDEGFQLSAEQIERAEISTTAAGAKTLVASLRLPAVAEQDLDAQSHVNAPLPGVVVAIQAVLGAEVEKGALMCTIRSAELAAAVADLHVDQSAMDTTLMMRKREDELLARGVKLAEETVSREESMREQGFGTARLLADAQAALQESQLKRDRRLLELDQMVARIELDIQAAKERIASWGFDDAFASTKQASAGLYTLHAKAAGVVLERHITVGEAVDSQSQLFFIQGMDEIWMLANVFENQLRFVDEGAKAIVRFHAFPEMEIEGVIDHIHHDLDEATRSVKARVKVRNRVLPGRKEPHPLLPGMYGSMEIETGEVDAMVVVSPKSLLHENGRDFVFTLSSDGFAKRRFVEVGLRSKNGVEILSGLDAGDLVVTDGVFVLKSLLHLESIGEDED